jgi:hypothetical protein
MKALMELRRLKKIVVMITWICLVYMGFHIPLSPASGDREEQQFQGVVMEIDSGKRTIYVNEMKVLVPKGTEITTTRDVRLSFQSLRPKQWVFIRVRSEGKNLIAERIVRIPRYIPPRERGKYRFFSQTRASR